MAKIKVISKCELFDGMSITFKAPCDCTAVDGLNVYYNEYSQPFSFRDAHGKDLAGLDNLFTEGAYIKVILDTGNGYAYIQNGDTNSYLEATFDPLITKDEVMSDVTKSAFGMDSASSPNDIFFNTYFWKRRTYERIFTYDVLEQRTENIGYSWGNNTPLTFYCYSSYEIREDEGRIVVSGEQTAIAYDYTQAYRLDGCVGKYVSYGDGVAKLTGFSKYNSGGDHFVNATKEPMVPTVKWEFGEWELLNSPDRSAYPDSGIVDGYQYYHIGRPFDKSLNGLSVKFGSYEGTGAYGSGSPITLEFDARPLFVFIFGDYTAFISGAKDSGNYVSFSGATLSSLLATWSGNTLSFYNESSALAQLNAKDTPYNYVAIFA